MASTRARRIFLGPSGMRAGWRLLIFLALTIALQATLQGILLLILKARGTPVPSHGLYALVFLVADEITFIAVVVATWVMAGGERRKLSDYGLPGKNAFGLKFWAGATFGFAGVSLLIRLIYLSGGYSPGSLALHGSALFRATVLWVLASLAIGLPKNISFAATRNSS